MSDNAVEHDALVAGILDDWRKIILNKGSQDGISTGDKFVVFGLGGEIHDPKTGESLGRLEEIKGKGMAIHVQDHMCTIETYEFEIETVVSVAHPHSFFQFPQQERKEKVYREFVDVQSGDYARKIRR